MKIEHVDHVVPPPPPSTPFEASPPFAQASNAASWQNPVVPTRVLRSATRRSTAASVASQPLPLPRPNRVRRVKQEPLADPAHTGSMFSLERREPPVTHNNYISLCYRRKPVFEFPPGNTYMLKERMRFKALQARRQIELSGLKPSLKKTRVRDDSDRVNERPVRSRKHVHFGGGRPAIRSQPVSVKEEVQEDTLPLNMDALKLA